MATALRVLAMDAVQAANSGHPGMPMGMADVATVLFRDVLKYDAAWPQWPDRDRFILSAGHGSMLLYSALYLSGYEDVSIDEIKNFRQMGSKTPGHPEYGHTEGVETTTGPLGQGIANSVGFAMAEQWLAARFGDELVDHFTYVIAGDGCLMEGVSQEAISLAGHLKLNKLIVLWDDNEITIDGKTDLSTSEDQRARFEAAGWHVQAVDGHDQDAVLTAIELAQQETSVPSMIACRTTVMARPRWRERPRRTAHLWALMACRNSRTTSAGHTRLSRFRTMLWMRGARPVPRALRRPQNGKHAWALRPKPRCLTPCKPAS